MSQPQWESREWGNLPRPAVESRRTKRTDEAGRRRATLKISCGGLTSLLNNGPHAYVVENGMPEDSSIVAATFDGDRISIVIQSPELAPVEDGDPCPLMVPMLRRLP